ncbi:unnamed protein product [Soboliphyme baturini]|uniref:Exonuclease domain-containing protein n=1 Tax=Soboliphyme baturini TaxID=241478 RepID=A0A183IMF3_9BILA|nr:unnamed protein product [Soboliphyme baturini]
MRFCIHALQMLKYHDSLVSLKGLLGLLEMTGLNIERDYLLEVACIITEGNKKLSVVEELPSLVIHQPDEIVESMDSWCKLHHSKSGLIKAVQESTLTVEKAEDILIKFIQKHTPAEKCPLAGNSVHLDKVFLTKFMPRVVNHLHYRIIDVSSLKELCR